MIKIKKIPLGREGFLARQSLLLLPAETSVLLEWLTAGVVVGAVNMAGA